MRPDLRTGRVLGALLLAIAACSGPDGDTASDGAPTQHDGIRIEHERARDLTGDGVAERIRVEAAGPAYDSLEVQLTIRGGGRVLHSARWNSGLYFFYEDRTLLSDSLVEARVREHLATLVTDSLSERGPPVLWWSERERTRELRASIRNSVAESMWRESHSVPPSEPLPREAYAGIAAIQPPEPRVDSLVRELRDRPVYAYYAGGEATYYIAWSDREQRFHMVYSCC